MRSVGARVRWPSQNSVERGAWTDAERNPVGAGRLRARCGADVSVRNFLPADEHSGQRFGAVPATKPRTQRERIVCQRSVRLDPPALEDTQCRRVSTPGGYGWLKECFGRQRVLRK